MMKGNIAGLMQQAQKMQQEMQKAQAELAQMEVTGQSGGGMVSVVMNGQHAVKRVSIDPGLVDDVEMLEAVGLGVAVANAKPEVLAVADQVTDGNKEDGVARALAGIF